MGWAFIHTYNFYSFFGDTVLNSKKVYIYSGLDYLYYNENSELWTVVSVSFWVSISLHCLRAFAILY